MKSHLALILSLGMLLSCSDDSSSSKSPSANESNKTSDDTTNVNQHMGMQMAEKAFTPLKGDIDPPFNSLDGLPISATISEISEDAPYMILCHQAGTSRGEYKDLSDWINTLGFNTLAIDQRSGRETNGVFNETAKRAKEQGLPMDYLSAEQDIRASVAHVADLLLLMDPEKPIYLMGSSYSASLVIKIAADSSFKYHDQIAGVMAFSPGEYFESYQLANDLPKVTCPLFVTCAKDEVRKTSALADLANDSLLTFYAPDKRSRHGASALWQDTEGHEGTRKALVDFLNNISPSGSH